MTSITEELKIKFIENRCSNDELCLVEQWINASPENAREIFELEHMAMLAHDLNRNAQQASRLEDLIESRIAQSRERQLRARRFSLYRWSGVAAALIAVVCCAAFWLINAPEKMINVTAHNGSLMVTLPDSTKVWLNNNASISYPEVFASHHRSVKIDGEAYFEVTRDKARPFIVEGKWLNVRVLGTKFNFNSVQGEENSVSLLEGSVEVAPTNNSDGVVLSPGQKVKFNPIDGKMKVVQVNAALDALWHDRLIHFYNATIAEIAADLETLYNVDITLLPSVDLTKTYSGATVSYSEVDSTLDALCSSLPLQFERRGSVIILSAQ